MDPATKPVSPEAATPRPPEMAGRGDVCETARVDPSDALQEAVSVQSLDMQDQQIAARLGEIAGLDDGWLDGQGVAPDKAKMRQIYQRLVGHYPEMLPLPSIVPTPEGNLLLEWDVAGSPSIDLR